MERLDTRLEGPALVRPPRAWDLALPEEFEDETRGATPADITDCVNVSADLGRHVAWIEELSWRTK